MEGGKNLQGTFILKCKLVVYFNGEVFNFPSYHPNANEALSQVQVLYHFGRINYI